MDNGGRGFAGNSSKNNSQNNIPIIQSLNSDGSLNEASINSNSQFPSQSQGHQQHHPNPNTNSTAFSPNFDVNALPAAERELLIRRFQQQQQLQYQRARQQQFQQAQAAQKMTMNAYSTPRPPLPCNPAGQNQFFVNPVNQMNPMMGYPQNYLARPVLGNPSNNTSTGINPALFQQHFQQQQQQHGGIKQINPQQFTNPLANTALKSDPVLFSVQQNQQPVTSHSPQAQAQPQPQQQSFSLLPLDEQILSSEGNFVEHLIKFLDIIKFTNRVVPQIANRPISLYRLFTVVTSLGGFVKVGETKKWPIVTHSLQLPANSYEIVSMIRATYYTFLYAYEQYFVQKRPFDKIEWPNQSKTSQTSTSTPNVNSNYSVPANNQAKVQPQIPAQTTSLTQPVQATPPSAQQNQSVGPVFNPQNLKFIPETELSLWKSFADVMKIPIYPILDIETSILYLDCPYFIFKVESLLAVQRIFAQLSTAKDLQSVGLSSDSLSCLLDALERLWNQSAKSIPKRENIPNKIMEDFWSEADAKKRELIEIESDDNKRDLMICRLICNLLRTMTLSKGSDIGHFISKSSFVIEKLLTFVLMQCNDLEIFKDSLIIFESISSHLSNAPELIIWEFRQCELELNQVRSERLTSLVTKFTGVLNLYRIGNFDNLISARQTVSTLITQCAQLWKSVPAHVFLHLNTCLNLLTSIDDTLEIDLMSFVLEVEKFMNIFVLPVVSLLRSVRALYECTNNFSNSQEEIRRVLETVIYSPNFSLTDGGFMEICLQILLKCSDNRIESLDECDWTGVILLLKELRLFWKHSNPENITNLGKVCYQYPSIISGSPAKKLSPSTTKLSLAILAGSTNIQAIFSHPFLLLYKSLSLLVKSFQSLPDWIKIDLLELTVEWNLETPSVWGKEVLGSERIEESLKVLREYYF